MENPVELPAPEEKFRRLPPIAKEFLPPSERKAIEPAEGEVVPDIGVRRGNFRFQIVRALREVAVVAQIERRWAVVDRVGPRIDGKEVQAMRDALGQLRLKRVVARQTHVCHPLNLPQIRIKSALRSGSRVEIDVPN